MALKSGITFLLKLGWGKGKYGVRVKVRLGLGFKGYANTCVFSFTASVNGKLYCKVLDWSKFFYM